MNLLHEADPLNALAAAALPAAAGAATLCAQVRRIDDAGIELALDDEADLVRARIAVSCLVAPLPGDRVAVFRDAAGRHYVTAVLERIGDGELHLHSERAINLSSARALSISGATIVLDAQQRLGLRAPLIEALGERFSACVRTLHARAGEALLDSRAARLCSEIVDVMAQRLGVSAQHSHREITGAEQVRCRDYDLRAESLASVRAETTLVKSKSLVKIDASQVQIG
jgi:hypothetical protein